MTIEMQTSKDSDKVLIKKCHVCGEILTSTKELKKCSKCNKSFLPSNYFSKIHAKTSKEFNNLFSDCHELHEEDLVRGIHVIW